VTPELRDLAPTIEGVARLIAEEEDDIEWLAGGLRASIWPQQRHSPTSRKFGSYLGIFADLARVASAVAQSTEGNAAQRSENRRQHAAGLGSMQLPR
jgi:hypothetical protein